MTDASERKDIPPAESQGAPKGWEGASTETLAILKGLEAKLTYAMTQKAIHEKKILTDDLKAEIDGRVKTVLTEGNVKGSGAKGIRTEIDYEGSDPRLFEGISKSIDDLAVSARKDDARNQELKREESLKSQEREDKQTAVKVYDNARNLLIEKPVGERVWLRPLEPGADGGQRHLWAERIDSNPNHIKFTARDNEGVFFKSDPHMGASVSSRDSTDDLARLINLYDTQKKGAALDGPLTVHGYLDHLHQGPSFGHVERGEQVRTGAGLEEGRG